MVHAASNEWVAPLNSDDQFVPGRFEAIQRAASSRDADLFFGDLVLIDGRGTRLGLRNACWHNEVPWPTTWNIDEMARRRLWTPLLLLQNIVATTTNMVFTKGLHDTLHGFKNHRYCHDWDFALRASINARVKYMPTMLSRYRLHSNNTIKDPAIRIIYDVRRMLGSVVAMTRSLREDPELMKILNANHYLSPSAPIPLAVVIEATEFRGFLEQDVSIARLPVKVVASLMDVSPQTSVLVSPLACRCGFSAFK